METADPGRYDQEVYLAIHHWRTSFAPMVETMRPIRRTRPQTSGSDVGYTYATINPHRLGPGEPVRVRQGHRVLLRLLNASATENVVLALPGHTFQRPRNGRQSRCRIPREVEVSRWPLRSAWTRSSR